MSEHRIFQFEDEKSSKLWSITLNDKSHTVWFGRAGTTGQTQVKDFPSAEAARLSYEKLVAEKVKKGYVEVDVKSWVVTTVFVDEPVPAQPTELLKQERALVDPESLEPERRINLDPLDYLWVSSPPEKPWPRPQPAAFDRKACEARLEKARPNRSATSSTSIWHYWRWDKAKIAKFLSQEEALFWFLAIRSALDPIRPLPEVPLFTNSLSAEEIAELLRKTEYVHILQEVIGPILCGLLPGAELFKLLFTLTKESQSQRSYALQWIDVFCEHFQSQVLPYLQPEDILEIRSQLQPEVIVANWPQNQYERPWAFFLAAYIDGLRDELKTVVESWPDDYYSKQFPYATHYQHPEEIIFAMKDKKQMIAQFQRLGIKFTTPKQVRAWLALTEFDALEIISQSIFAQTNKEEAIKLTKAFGGAVAPEIAVQMLQLTTESKSAQPAHQWLNEHPIETIVGLLPLVQNRSRFAQNAIDILQSLAKRGYEPFIRLQLSTLEKEVADRMSADIFDMGGSNLPVLDESTTPDWLHDALKTVTKPKKVSDWVSSGDLPAITIASYQLNLGQVDQLLLALRQSTFAEQQPFVKALKEHSDPSSLDRFAWKLFERWLSVGASSKESWAMTAVGLFGGDASALKLAPMIRVWPGESQHQRAVNGLECLRAIGTDTALMQINGIAQKVKFQGIKNRAQECMEGIASDRNLSRAQLEDRIVPDCGLDENGKRVFDFGVRQFQFVLGENLKPLVRDSDGKTKPDLPKPNSKDDQEQANQAIADWKLLKKQVTEVAKIQAVRLEQAMATGWRWSSVEFLLFFVQHPLMNHIAQLLIWAGFDSNGKLIKTFRVSEDRTLADVNEETLTLESVDQVGIVHPLLLQETELSAWGEVVSDYAIVPPFPQLGRPVYALESAEHEAEEITRFKNIDIPVMTLVRTLENLGWEKGDLHDHGDYSVHLKYFPSENVTAIVGDYEEVFVQTNLQIGNGLEKIDGCCFVKGYPKNTWSYPVGSTWGRQEYEDAILSLGQVDALVISEVLKDLYTVSSKVS
jgi:predicted DNA-binding WGR domain protein